MRLHHSLFTALAPVVLANAAMTQAIGTDQGNETEPNNTFATADPLTGSVGKIKGSLFNGVTGAQGTEVDFYSFTAAAGSKVYAITQNFQSNSADSQLAIIAPDGTTVLEFDDDNGSFGGLSPSIAGTTLAAGGTYYFRVTNFSLTNPVSSYTLMYAVQDPTTLVAETEPNNNGTPQALPASGYVSGVVDPIGDTDTFTFMATAGDTVFLSGDLDPERDAAADANLFIGLGLFGTPANFLVTSDAGTADLIPSEGGAWTVKTTGVYQAFVSNQVAGVGGPTATYHLSVTILSPAPLGPLTTYTNAVSTPLADLALTTSSIVIPDSKIIKSLKVVVDVSHTNIPDLDVHLRSPSVNDNGLFTDVGIAAQTGAQNVSMFDADALPIVFTVLNGVNWQTELSYRLNWFRGENTLGTWFLDIRDDLTANTGTLNSWSITVEEELPSSRPLVYSEDFEAGNGGYVSSGTGSEWEHGTPATPAQLVTSPFCAPFAGAGAGVNCWKTDLDNTYNASSINILTSPSIDLSVGGGTGPLTLHWLQRYQIETPSFDRAWIRVTNVADATDTLVVWHNDLGAGAMSESNGSGASLANLAQSAGWGQYSADISSFAGKTVTVSFNLEADSSLQVGGWAVDNIQIRTNDLCPDDPNKTDPGVCGCGVPDVDTDGDLVLDCNDNCVSIQNPGQENADGDDFGDACDNCTLVVNNGQENSDTDAFGDACDNCDLVDNPGQEDLDSDGVGNVCDNCPNVANPGQADSDFDGYGDDCDSTITEICGVTANSALECPCGPGNNTAGGLIGNGCPNSGLLTGILGAHLGASGNAILGADTLSVSATNVRQGNGTVSLFLAGDDDPQVPFNDGLICSSNNIIKLWVWKDPVGPAGSGGGITSQSGPGGTTIPPTTTISQRSSDLGSPILNGQTRVYTMVYRDPSLTQGCPHPSTTNTTNGVRVVWASL